MITGSHSQYMSRNLRGAGVQEIHPNDSSLGSRPGKEPTLVFKARTTVAATMAQLRARDALVLKWRET